MHRVRARFVGPVQSGSGRISDGTGDPEGEERESEYIVVPDVSAEYRGAFSSSLPRPFPLRRFERTFLVIVTHSVPLLVVLARDEEASPFEGRGTTTRFRSKEVTRQLSTCLDGTRS